MTVAERGEQEPALEVDVLGVGGHRMPRLGDDAVDDHEPVDVGRASVDPDRAAREDDGSHGNLLESRAARNIQRRFQERYGVFARIVDGVDDSSRTPYTAETRRIA